MANERLGEAGLTNEHKLFNDKLLLMRAVPNLVHNQFGIKKNIPRRGGKSIGVRRLETISATTTAFTEGSFPAETQITISEVQATLQQYGQWTPLSEVALGQSLDDVAAELSVAYGETMGNSLDQLTRNVITAGTTIQYNGAKGSRGDIGSGDIIDAAELREAANTLARLNAKTLIDGKYMCIIHPDTTRDMLGDSTIVTTFERAGLRGGENPLLRGEMGDYMRLRFVETSNARVFSSLGLSGADVYATMVIGQEAYMAVDYEDKSENGPSPASMIVHAPGSSGVSDPLNTRGTIGWKAAHAAARLNENFMLRLEHITTTGGNSA